MSYHFIFHLFQFPSHHLLGRDLGERFEEVERKQRVGSIHAKLPFDLLDEAKVLFQQLRQSRTLVHISDVDLETTFDLYVPSSYDP